MNQKEKSAPSLAARKALDEQSEDTSHIGIPTRVNTPELKCGEAQVQGNEHGETEEDVDDEVRVNYGYQKDLDARVDADQVVRALETIIDPEHVFEVRVLRVSDPDSDFEFTLSGYFDDQHIAKVPEQIRGLECRGVYVTPNTVQKKLLARSANLLSRAESGNSTADSDTTKRRWLLVDIDPIRPSGVPATAEQHLAAQQKALAIRESLTAAGWPKPIVIDSGNGAYLLYLINLPTEDSGLCQRVLAGLAAQHDDEVVEIDQCTHNPSRLMRLPGTMNLKGDEVPEKAMYHRMCRLVEVPEVLESVPNEHLEEVASPAENRAEKPGWCSDANAAGDQGAWIKNWVKKHQAFLPEHQGWVPWKDGEKLVFKTCPFNSAHDNASAYITVAANGAIGFGCHHKSCLDKKWKQFRELIESKAKGDAAEDVEAWPELVTEPTYKSLPLFPKDALPKIIALMAEEISNCVKVTFDMAVITLLSVCGLACGRDICTKIKQGIEARPNIYSLLFVARGERKSTAYQIAVEPLMKWISGKKIQYQQYEVERDMRRAKIGRLKDAIINPKTNSKCLEAHKEQLCHLSQEDDAEFMRSPFVLVEDSTPEAVLVRMKETGGTIGLFSDDARSVFEIIVGLYSSGKVRVGLWIRSYDGTTPINEGRVGRASIYIERPFAALLLMVQTDWLLKLGEEADMADSGFFSRNIFCVPDSLVGKRNEDESLVRAYDDREVNADIAEQYSNLIRRLLKRAYKRIDQEEIAITAEAKAAWVEYHDQVEGRLGQGGAYSEMVDVAIRYPINALRLALQFALIHDRKMIEVIDMTGAIKVVEYYAHHAERAWQSMKRYQLPDEARRILRHVRKHRLKTLSVRDAQHSVRLKTVESASEAFDVLQGKDYCRPAKEQPKGKASMVYEFNPAIFSGGE